MKNDTTELRTVGLDLGDKESTYVVLNRDGVIEREGKVATTAAALRKLLGKGERTVVALEVGTHSPWVSFLLKGMKHHVVVANPRPLRDLKNLRALRAAVLQRRHRARYSPLPQRRERGWG